jgi:general secretion pathway protein A
MIYNEYFGFIEEPFGVTPDPKFLFMSRGHEEAMAHIMYGIGQNRGFIMLTGEVGSGKTTLIRHIFQTLDPKMRTAMILNPRMDALELLKFINHDFGLEVKGRASHKGLMDSLNDFLLECHREGGKALLVIDEAQELSPECLEFVRLLSNLETDTRKLLQVVLIGQPELRDMVKQERLRQLNQRIAVRYHLEPLDRADTERYLIHRLHVAGALGLSFPNRSVGHIHSFSGGIPRLINLAADRSLMKTFSEGALKIRNRTVRQAVDELRDERARKSGRALRPSLVKATILALFLAAAAGIAIKGPWILNKISTIFGN